MKKISVVIPLYKCSSFLIELNQRLNSTLKNITQEYEIIYVVDGSPEDEWGKLNGIAGNNKKVKGLLLSRNFGQHYAITAGLVYSNAEWIVVMDGDLQDKPEEIPKLYKKAQEGYDIVFGRRHDRKDNFVKKLFSRLFYFLFSYLTETKQDYTVANFGIFSKSVVKEILNMGDYFRVFPVLVQWVGFKKTYINVDHNWRLKSKSGYSYKKLIRLAFDMIISFSEKPLKLGMKFGILISIISFIVGIYYLILYLSGKIQVAGYTSLIITITFSTGIIISFLGLVGVYIGKLSMQVKNRPRYIVKQQINM